MTLGSLQTQVGSVTFFLFQLYEPHFGHFLGSPSIILCNQMYSHFLHTFAVTATISAFSISIFITLHLDADLIKLFGVIFLEKGVTNMTPIFLHIFLRLPFF